MNLISSKIFVNCKPKLLTLFGMLLVPFCLFSVTSRAAEYTTVLSQILTAVQADKAANENIDDYLNERLTYILNSYDSDWHDRWYVMQPFFSRDFPNSMAHVTNHLRYIVNQDWTLFTGLDPDDRIKLSNPNWRATNNLAYYFSQIWKQPEVAILWSDYDGKRVPFPQSNRAQSIPEAMSLFMSSRTRDTVYNTPPTSYDAKAWVNAFGKRVNAYGFPTWFSENEENGLVYTFEDFVADAFKSNWVQTNVGSLRQFTNNATAMREMNQYFGTPTQPTSQNSTNETDIVHDFNDTFADMIPDKRDIDGSLDVLDLNWDDWHPNLSNGSDELTIFPGHTLTSGFQVPEVKVHLTLPAGISSILYGAMTFLWSVIFFWSVLGLVKTEFDYWSTLGGSAS